MKCRGFQAAVHDNALSAFIEGIKIVKKLNAMDLQLSRCSDAEADALKATKARH